MSLLAGVCELNDPGTSHDSFKHSNLHYYPFSWHLGLVLIYLSTAILFSVFLNTWSK